ncbi:MAG: hypothetical protein ACREAN_03825 [Nitrosopumilaceae archaeon]
MSFFWFQPERGKHEDKKRRDPKGSRRANRPVLSGDESPCYQGKVHGKLGKVRGLKESKQE